MLSLQHHFFAYVSEIKDGARGFYFILFWLILLHFCRSLLILMCIAGDKLVNLYTRLSTSCGQGTN